MEGPKTPRGEEYKQRYPEQLKAKLAVARDAEGNPNWEPFEVAEEWGKRMEKYPWYVGMVPNGSKMKGYSKPITEDSSASDMDLVMLFDQSKTDYEEEHIWNQADEEKRNLDHELKSVPDSSEALMRALWRADLHCVDVSERQARTFIEGTHNKNEFFGVWYLFGPAKGGRVEEYRQKFRDMFREQPEPTQQKIIQRLTSHMVENETSRWFAMTGRTETKEYGKFDFKRWKSVFPERSKMWQERIEKILDANEQSSVK